MTQNTESKKSVSSPAVSDVKPVPQVPTAEVSDPADGLEFSDVTFTVKVPKSQLLDATLVSNIATEAAKTAVLALFKEGDLSQILMAHDHASSAEGKAKEAQRLATEASQKVGGFQQRLEKVEQEKGKMSKDVAKVGEKMTLNFVNDAARYEEQLAIQSAITDALESLGLEEDQVLALRQKIGNAKKAEEMRQNPS